MSDPDIKPWERFCDFAAESTRTFRAFSMALDAKKLLFAFCGVVLWMVGTMLLNILPQWLVPIAAGLVAIIFIFVAAARSRSDVASRNFVLALVGAILGVIVVVALLVWAGAQVRGPGYLMNTYRVLWALAVASFFGTAVCRIAALDAATEEAISPRETLRFSLAKLSTSIWTLLTPILAVVGFGIVLLVIGAIARIPVLGHVWYVIIGLLYIVALLGGLFFAITLLVYIPGLALFQPAIGAEGNDSFDAISRAYSYVFGRPWRLLFYGIIALVYGKIVLAVVSIVFAWAGRITNIFLSQGAGEKIGEHIVLDLGRVFGMPVSTDPLSNVALAAEYLRHSVFGPVLSGPFFGAGRHIMDGNVYETFKNAGHPGGWLMVFWQYVLLAVFLAFAVSFIYSLFTQIYFLMRKACDGTPFEEIYIETPEEEEYAGEFPEKPEPEEPAGEGSPSAEAPPEEPEPETEKEDKPIDLSEGAEGAEETDKTEGDEGEEGKKEDKDKE